MKTVDLMLKAIRAQESREAAREKAIGAFPDGQSALMLACARLPHVATTNWCRRHMNMDHLFNPEED